MMRSTVRDRGSPAGDGHDPADDVSYFKRRLLQPDADIPDANAPGLGRGAIRQSPKLIAVALFAAGLAAGRLPFVRRAMWTAGLWAAKRALRRRLRRRDQPRRAR